MTVYRRPDPLPMPRPAGHDAMALEMAPLRPESDNLEALAARRIFIAILSDRFRIGHHLPSEEALANELRVSRTVIREALKRLSGKGVVQARRRFGTLVLAKSDWSSLDAELVRWTRMAGRDEEVSRMQWEAAKALMPPIAAGAAPSGSAAALAKADSLARLAGEPNVPNTIARAFADLAIELAMLHGNPILQHVVLRTVGDLAENDAAGVASRLRNAPDTAFRGLASALLSRDSVAAARAMTEIISGSRAKVAADLPMTSA